ncbi:MAG TPA: phosphatase PAP2 family protein [Candidatus Pacearchaeota archaeon]|nr:phosphatase PAP2 family protein [Candidatus Pacearchaeota archaeon]
MKERKAVFTWIIFSLFMFFVFRFDSDIVKGISMIRNSVLSNFFIGITFFSSSVIIFIFLTALFIWKNKKKWILPLWLTMLVSVIISFLLKVSIQRMRPYQMELISILPGFESLAHIIWNFSFPSFQAMLVFSAVPFLSKEFPRFRYVWIIFASLVALSRVYLGVHFLSDVILGGLIGYLIGAAIIKTEKENKYCERFYKKIFKK